MADAANLDSDVGSRYLMSTNEKNNLEGNSR